MKGILGLVEAGGNYVQVKQYIREQKLDTSHFHGQAWNKGLTGLNKPHLPLAAILTRDSKYQSFKLKKRLFNAGLKKERMRGMWLGSLQRGRVPST